MTSSVVVDDNIKKWQMFFSRGGPRNYYPHSYVVSWYFKYVHPHWGNVINKKVLDVGCGTAPDLYLFATEGFEYFGIDVTSVCFEEIRRKAKTMHLNQNLIHLNTFMPPLFQYSDASFDVIVGLESLHFNATDESMMTAVGEVFRVLKKGGHFFFTTINKKHFFVRNDNSRFVTDTCLVIEKGFPEKERIGLKYYVFSNTDKIYELFKNFSEVKVGEYYYDTCDGQPDAYYLIFGKK